MNTTIQILYWSAMAACLLGGSAGIILHVVGKEQVERRNLWIVPASALTLFLVVLWIMRWVAAGHMPIFGNYESAISVAVAIMIATVTYQLRASVSSLAGPAAALVAGAVLVHGGLFDDSAYALTISERSWVVDVHAIFAWGAFGVLTANAGLSLHTLVRQEPTEAQTRLLARTLEIGFVLHTGMLLSGSLYRFLLFGKAWNFDPIETMGLTAWLAYGTLMHMVRFAGWRGRRLAQWSLFLFVLLVISYRVIVYFPASSTYHIFEMNQRVHVSG